MKKILFSLLLILGAAQQLHAQTSISIRGSGRTFPIGVPQLCVDNGESSARVDIPKIIARDLSLTGYFDVLNPASYIENKGGCRDPKSFAYSDWSVIGAEGLVRGVVEPSGDELRVQLFLHIVPKQQVVLGKEYTGDLSQVPMIAHKFANEIVRYFTGEPASFGSQIAFTSKVGRFKELFVMDMDGSNIRQLTNDKSLNVSAAWHPNGSELVFTSYRQRVPDIYTIDVASKRQKQVTRSVALDIGAHFFNSGNEIIFSTNDGRESDIVVSDRAGRVLRRLTHSNGAIDVSASLSADNSQVAFVSNRSGGPQIYVMGSDGSNPRRVSFVNANYCTSPAWSSRGNKLAFVCRADAGFQLFVSEADGSSPLQLTSAGDNEDPEWSPDGRYIAFATTFWRRGVFSLALIREDGAGMKQLTNSRVGDSEPTWGPIPY